MFSTVKAMRLILLSATLAAISGCFGLNRGEPAQRHYVLGLGLRSADSTSPGGAERASGIVVGLRALHLAEYLETPLIVVRQGPNQIGFSEFHRWGESLGYGINRTVAGYMATAASIRRVEAAPWPVGSELDYLIRLRIERFEGVSPEEEGAEGEAYVMATWEIAAGEDRGVLARGTTEYRAPGWAAGDYEGLVGLLEAGLRVVAGDLVARLEHLSGEASPP